MKVVLIVVLGLFVVLLIFGVIGLVARAVVFALELLVVVGLGALLWRLVRRR